MPLDIQTQQQFVANEIAAILSSLAQSGTTPVFQFQPGSIILALVEAHARTGIWLESLAQFVLARTRLTTSSGIDVDSFVNQFGLFREPGTAAKGLVTFTSFSATQQRLIPVGATVTTSGLTLSFAVYVDTTNPNYNPSLNAYVMAPSVTFIDVPVACSITGTTGNVAANTITVINSPIPGVDLVTNAIAFTNAVNPQTDAQLRAFFVLYLNSLSRATLMAIEYSIAIVQTGLLYSIVENIDYTSQLQRLGFFYAIVDDGTGFPPSPLLAAVSASINAYRGLTIAYEVHAPVVVPITVVTNIILPAGFSDATLIADITAAIVSYINAIPMAGGILFYLRLSQIIYNAILTDINNDSVFLDSFKISVLTINGGTSDIASTNVQALRTNTGLVTVTTSYS